ncbi:MAG: Fic family protein [Clostridia bacterium]|nr:Fic family protein [Clostridia bacterium]
MHSYEQIVAMWQAYNIQTEADIDLRLHSFRILFAYNSGKIENDRISYHDTREIFENRRILNYTGDTRTLFEQENQKLCYEFLKKKLIEKEPLSISLILEIHNILTSGTYDERRFIELGERPGMFKKHDFVIGREEAGSLPGEVESDLKELLCELDEHEKGDVLKVATYLHARFEYIHPFADGNGRVGRTLMNYYLMAHGHPPIVIHDERKKEYYAALESYDRDEDLESLHAFLQSETCATWQKALARV